MESPSLGHVRNTVRANACDKLLLSPVYRLFLFLTISDTFETCGNLLTVLTLPVHAIPLDVGPVLIDGFCYSNMWYRWSVGAVVAWLCFVSRAVRCCHHKQEWPGQLGTQVKDKRWTMLYSSASCRVPNYDPCLHACLFASRASGEMCLPGRAGFASTSSDVKVVPFPTIETYSAVGKS